MRIRDLARFSVPHDEAYTLLNSIPGLKRATVRGCFSPHVMELMLIRSRRPKMGKAMSYTVQEEAT